MDKRLRTYQFKRLENPKKKAVAWLRKHPMECVVWAAEQAKCCKPDSDSDDTDSDMENGQHEEGNLQQEEKQELKALSRSDPPVKDDESVEAQLSEEECPDAGTQQSNDEDAEPANATPSNTIVDLRAALSRAYPGSLRYRQVEHMLREQEQRIASRRNLAEKKHQLQKASLRERGVSTQTADLLPVEPDEAMPTPILIELQRHCDRRKAQEDQERREKVRRAFEGTWIRATEVELKNCCDKYQSSSDPTVRANVKEWIKVLCDKLKMHHESLGTFNTAEAVQERIKVCTALGLLREEQQHLVTSVAERLPVLPRPVLSSETEGVQQHAHETDEEQSIFITPLPSTSGASMPHSSFDDCAVSAALLRATTTNEKKRKRHSSSQRAVKKSQNVLTRYFTSQK